MLDEQNKMMDAAGISHKMMLLDPTKPHDTSTEPIISELRDSKYHVVSIGAGVRTTPQHFLLFELLVNLVHTHAPQATIAFDTGPHDKAESMMRALSRKSE